jgi:hypothetical protein
VLHHFAQTTCPVSPLRRWGCQATEKVEGEREGRRERERQREREKERDRDREAPGKPECFSAFFHECVVL